jgi:hypothetical protein
MKGTYFSAERFPCSDLNIRSHTHYYMEQEQVDVNVQNDLIMMFILEFQ